MSKKEIQDNEVYFLGSGAGGERNPAKKRWYIAGIAIVVVVFISIAILLLRSRTPDYYEPETKQTTIPNTSEVKNNTIAAPVKGFVTATEETVNDVPMLLYTPHNATMTLAVGMPDKTDTTLVLVAQAADIRADNMDIVGDFVLAGKQLSRGVAKTGFCAVIDGTITIGVAAQTPLLQQAIESDGYFFRQYPLVKNGAVIENNPKNKSIRRAIATRNGKVIMVESRSQESFHDFAQALVDIGVNDAIYIVGGIAYGWYYDSEQKRYEFGVEQDRPQSTSYIVFSINNQ